jgi:hypothetical protein
MAARQVQFSTKIERLTTAFDNMILYFMDLAERFPRLKPISDKFSQSRNLKLFLTAMSTIPEIIEISDEEHDSDRERIAIALVERLMLEYDLDISEFLKLISIR